MNQTDQYMETDFFVEEFKKFHGPGNGVLTGIRKQAMDSFTSLGFPTTKHEEWKYTNVSPIIRAELRTADKTLTLDNSDIHAFCLAGKDSIRLVFENGIYNSKLSTQEELGSGIIIGNLADYMEHPEVKKNLTHLASFSHASFVALNTAFINQGAFIFIPDNAILEKPIQLMYIHDTRKAAVVMYPRNLVITGKNSKVNIVESLHSIGEIHQGFSNSVTEIYIGENSFVEYDKIQNPHINIFHISHTEVCLEQRSNFSINTITLGGKIVRNNLDIRLLGENSEANLNGLYSTQQDQLVDNHTLVDHATPNCRSNELYKGILDDNSQGVFNGKVLVRQDAQKTNAYQSNKNILLSDNASMNTKPQLEIFADDVKCSHGATTGMLDVEALFYLRSRGIGEANAKAFLNIAFAADVISKIGIPQLKDRLLQLIEQKLKKSAGS